MNALLIKIAIACAAVLALLLTGTGLVKYLEGRGADRQWTADKALIDAQKVQASRELQALTAQAAKAQADLSDKITKLEVEREKLQRENSAALLAHSNGPSLHYTAQAVGCGAGSGGATAAPGGAASDPGTAVYELPGQISRDLWRLAADAQSLAIDYRVLWDYVHDPKLVCSLQD